MYISVKIKLYHELFYKIKENYIYYEKKNI